MINEMTKRI